MDRFTGHVICYLLQNKTLAGRSSSVTTRSWPKVLKCTAKLLQAVSGAATIKQHEEIFIHIQEPVT